MEIKATPSAPSGSSSDLGVGVGLRVPHYQAILEQRPAIDFFEIISENFMLRGGKPLYHLERILEHYPVVPHGVSLGIGSPDEPSIEYLAELKRLVRRVQPAWVSDHLCWNRAGSHHSHDLLPLPYTKASVERVVERAKRVQDTLELPFALENTSSYLTYRSSQMSEWEFITEIAERADIRLLLDVNNVYVSAYNHHFDPDEYIQGLPLERVIQIHLAGHTNLETHIIDTHSGPVIDAVWRLYQRTIQRAGPVSTLIEWDEAIPPLPRLLEEVARARQLRAEALSTHHEIEKNPHG